MFVLLVIWREWLCEWLGRFRINADVFSRMMGKNAEGDDSGMTRGRVQNSGMTSGEWLKG